MAIISAFPGGSGGGGIDYATRPKITFDGKWISWFIEFYGGEPYWEAWLLSSGTLSAEEPYTADAWGIGGGGSTNWSSGGGRRLGGTGGRVGVAYGLEVSGMLAVTIGAGATNQRLSAGGTTTLGNLLTCLGGAEPSGATASGDPNRYRFIDAQHQSDMGADVTYKDVRSAGGWLPVPENMYEGSAGQGFGGGGGYYGYAKSGALVIRIKI